MKEVLINYFTFQNFQRKSEEKLVMSSIYSTVVSRGEERTLISSWPNQTTVVVFISPIWKKNSYGEIVLYSSSGTEELARVQPRFGRVVVVPPFDGDVVVRPPSFSQNQDGKFVVATFENEKHVNVYKDAVVDETVVGFCIYKQFTSYKLIGIQAIKILCTFLLRYSLKNVLLLANCFQALLII